MSYTNPDRNARFDAGTGSVVLDGVVSGSHVHVRYDEFSVGDNSGTIVRGDVDGVALYRAKFERDGTLFVIARDGDHETKLLFAGTADPDVYHLVVIHDAESPASFTISKRKLIEALDSRDLGHALLSGDPARLDLAGRRVAPKLTTEAMYEAFGHTDDFKRFMRDRPSMASLLGSKDSSAARAKSIPGICIALFFCPGCALIGIACALLA